MYNDLNSCLLEGRLTHDLEIKELAGGSKTCSISIAINRYFKDRNGSDAKDTTFIDVEVWNTVAENCVKYLKKGDSVRVVGELRYNTWTREDGSTAHKHYLACQHIEFRPKSNAHKAKSGEEEPPMKEMVGEREGNNTY